MLKQRTRPRPRTNGNAPAVLESSPKIQAVEIRAELRQIKTMVDSTVNLTLNLPEDCLEQAKILLGWQGEEIRVVIEQWRNGKT